MGGIRELVTVIGLAVLPRTRGNLAHVSVLFYNLRYGQAFHGRTMVQGVKGAFAFIPRVVKRGAALVEICIGLIGARDLVLFGGCRGCNLSS